ncbi:hypothetical protein [Sphingobacterium faecale]|uniref:GLPGLI family protein n=1 Tax=Sphingobacterium faecale TaxID=2803775 RepID=A0ABS1R3J9_9SPHI|nr:hypothetical protein [Sphingobacterium faecale]MBL1408446.1 hypothetical protein [Sphingobacterium faecale]
MKTFFLITANLLCIHLSIIAQNRPPYYSSFIKAADDVFVNLEPLFGRYFLKERVSNDKDDKSTGVSYQYHLKLEHFEEQMKKQAHFMKDWESQLLEGGSLTDLNDKLFNLAGQKKEVRDAYSIKHDSLLLTKQVPGYDFYVRVSINEEYFYPYAHNLPNEINQLFPVQIPLAAHAYHVFTANIVAKQYGLFYFGNNWPKTLPSKTANMNDRPKYKFQGGDKLRKIENIVVEIDGPKEITDWFVKQIDWSIIYNLIDR